MFCTALRLWVISISSSGVLVPFESQFLIAELSGTVSISSDARVAHRFENTKASNRELDASLFAPCNPV